MERQGIAATIGEAFTEGAVARGDTYLPMEQRSRRDMERQSQAGGGKRRRGETRTEGVCRLLPQISHWALQGRDVSDLIRIAVDRFNPPFSRLNSFQDAEGFSIDVIRGAYASQNVVVNFVPVDGPMAQLLWLAAGRVDAAADMTVTERRRAWFGFSQWYHMEELMIFGLRDGPLWPGFRAFHGRLAAKANSYVLEYLIRRHPHIPLVIVDSTEAELEALRDGRVSHIAATRETGNALIQAEGVEDLVAEGTPFGPAPLALAILTTSDQATVEIFDRGLDRIRREGTLARIERQWLSHYSPT